MTRPPTYARRTDDNHAAIRDVMRQEGLQVLDLSGSGGGIPDTLCRYGERMVFVEIKNSAKPPSQRKLTAAQRRFFSDWRGVVVVVTSEEEARDFARGMIDAKA